MDLPDLFGLHVCVVCLEGGCEFVVLLNYFLLKNIVETRIFGQRPLFYTNPTTKKA